MAAGRESRGPKANHLGHPSARVAPPEEGRGESRGLRDRRHAGRNGSTVASSRKKSQKHTPGLREETGGVLQMDSVTPVRRADYIVFIFRTIASAIWRVPTAVGSLRSAFMS